MGKVEIVLFNCPQWGIVTKTITLATMGGSTLINSVDPTLTSCDSLVKVCMLYFVCDSTSLRLIFSFNGTPSWVHLAEVTFYEGNYSTTCPPDAFVPASTTSPTMLTTTANVMTSTGI